MIDISNTLILLKGVPQTLRISSISESMTGMYEVHFNFGSKSYTYNKENIICLKNPASLEVVNCNVCYNGNKLNDVTQILKFNFGTMIFWRIKYGKGYVCEDSDGIIDVAFSCLGNQKTHDTFEYLRQAAFINPLKIDGAESSILSSLYKKVDFIGEKSAAACYLNPADNKIAKHRCSSLIYPFGCNKSQMSAVLAAFENQCSVIKGPPGTGKTQTILNIIANIVSSGKSAIIVSNNNSAIDNIFEKLNACGLAFISARLGKVENKEAFFKNQLSLPEDIFSWKCIKDEKINLRQEISSVLKTLEIVFDLQIELAKLNQELQAIDLEWRHFISENSLHLSERYKRIKSEYLINLWLKCQLIADADGSRSSNRIITSLKVGLRLFMIKLTCKYWLHLNSTLDKSNLHPAIVELQILYYRNKIAELHEEISKNSKIYKEYDAEFLNSSLKDLSMRLLKASLYDRYIGANKGKERHAFGSIRELSRNGNLLKREYPVVLSTAFSARSCLFGGAEYDYIIMDEASQVPIETGALALTCAKNAVIVGDNLQLPNVVTEENRQKLEAVGKKFLLSDAYNCAKHSFLDSMCSVLNDLPQTLLKEHYRCHPRIINFCNQKFYGGELLIMIKDKGEDDVLSAVMTVEGNHACNNFNQREIDAVKDEILPEIGEHSSIAIITPYNKQADAFRSQIPGIDASTIHKYQGREVDAVILSVVDNIISEFADNPNLLNVAVSRAKKKFYLVVTGNKQNCHGNVMDLLDYIEYNNFSVRKSKVSSIYDCLYKQYTVQRMNFISSHPKISEYTSENLTYNLIKKVLDDDSSYKVKAYEIFCHFPLRQIIKDTSFLSDEEIKYVLNSNTHVDFLIASRVSKKPVLAIETDGYTYHNKETEQYKRDVKKNHICQIYGLPVLRLSTKGSNEEKRIRDALSLNAE